MKNKQIDTTLNMLDEVHNFYKAKQFAQAKGKLLEILAVNQINLNEGNIVAFAGPRLSGLIGYTFSSLAIIAGQDGEPEEAINLYNKSVGYYAQQITQFKKFQTQAKAEIEFSISGVLYNISAIYQDLKFIEKDKEDACDTEKVKEYTSKEREYLVRAASNHTDVNEVLSDEARHRISTIYYNLAKNYEADNELEKELSVSLNKAKEYYKLALAFADSVSENYQPGVDVFTIEATKLDIKQAIEGISNLLNDHDEEIIARKSQKKLASKASRKAQALSQKEELEAVSVVNNDLEGGLAKLAQFIDGLKGNPAESSLWEHQKKCLAAICQELRNGTKYGYVNMATGTGKTKVFTALVEVMGMEAIIVAPTNILVEQTAKVIQEISPHLSVGIIDATHKRKGVNVTVITYASFEKMHQLPAFKDVKLIILDEAHSSLSAKRAGAVNSFKANPLLLSSSSVSSSQVLESVGPIIIGFTATDKYTGLRKPEDYSRVDQLLPAKIFTYTIEQGISDKVLHACDIVEIELDESVTEDFARIIKSHQKHEDGAEVEAEVTAAELEPLKSEKINKVLTDFICNVAVPGIGKTLRNESGLIFAIDIAHAEAVAKEINQTLGEGYAVSLHYQMSKKEQREILERHKSGAIKTLVNVDMLTVGYDDKKLTYIIDFRPTRSSIRLAQTFGRLTRRDEGNPDAKIYVQLVIPKLFKKVSDLFRGQTSLGERAHKASSSATKAGAEVETPVASHCYYQVRFPDGSPILERGDKNKGLTGNPLKRFKASHSSSMSVSQLASNSLEGPTPGSNNYYAAVQSGALNDPNLDKLCLEALDSFLDNYNDNEETRVDQASSAVAQILSDRDPGVPDRSSPQSAVERLNTQRAASPKLGPGK